jgi:hypothetical protein
MITVILAVISPKITPRPSGLDYDGRIAWSWMLQKYERCINVYIQATAAAAAAAEISYQRFSPCINNVPRVPAVSTSILFRLLIVEHLHTFHKIQPRWPRVIKSQMNKRKCLHARKLFKLHEVRPGHRKFGISAEACFSVFCLHQASNF